jgi:hypothetical protein
MEKPMTRTRLLAGAVIAAEPDALLIEECAQFHECSRLAPWKSSGKPVWQVEYRTHFSSRQFGGKVCRKAEEDGRFALLKREPPDGGYRRTCA